MDILRFAKEIQNEQFGATNDILVQWRHEGGRGEGQAGTLAPGAGVSGGAKIKVK